MVGGMVVILFGVALVRASGPRPLQVVVPSAPGERLDDGVKKRKRCTTAITPERFR
jgi:hypothetical protein